MPVTISKKDGYEVRTPGGVKAKNTTLAKALAQRRLLQGIEHGWTPTGRAGSPKFSRQAAKIALAKLRARKKK